MIFITTEQAIAMNKLQIDLFGGSLGIRDRALLESAIMTVKQTVQKDYVHSFPFEMAAAYLFHIANNHAFIDGNKRTALHVCLTFLHVNQYDIHTINHQKLEQLVMDTATRKTNKKDIAGFLETNCQKSK